MNYIKEINAFDDWLETNQLSASAISFYRAIMQVANKTGWKASFAVAISTIESKTGFKRSALYKGRNQLAQKGRLKFTERLGNQSAVYQIIPFCDRLTDATVDTMVDTSADTTVDTGRTQLDTINKLNSKQNETGIPPPPENDNPPKNQSEIKPVAPPDFSGQPHKSPLLEQSEIDHLATQFELSAIVLQTELDQPKLRREFAAFANTNDFKKKYHQDRGAVIDHFQYSIAKRCRSGALDLKAEKQTAATGGWGSLTPEQLAEAANGAYAAGGRVND